MYKIVGGDQKEYGPVTADQVRQWIAQNRANGNTIVSFEGGPWKPLSTYPEFADVLGRGRPQAGSPGTPTYTTAQNVFDTKRSNWLGVTSLVLGIVSIFPCCCLCPLPALVGVVLGVIGLVQIHKSPESYTTSRNTPIAGIVLCIVSIIIGVTMYNSPAFEQQLRKIEQELERMK